MVEGRGVVAIVDVEKGREKAKGSLEGADLPRGAAMGEVPRDGKGREVDGAVNCVRALHVADGGGGDGTGVAGAIRGREGLAEDGVDLPGLRELEKGGDEESAVGFGGGEVKERTAGTGVAPENSLKNAGVVGFGLTGNGEVLGTVGGNRRKKKFGGKGTLAHGQTVNVDEGDTALHLGENFGPFEASAVGCIAADEMT